jgi:hypothetical protein
VSFDYSRIPFKQARYYHNLKPGRHIQLVVLHTMEAPKKGTTAESVASYFNKMPDGRKASAHYCIDSNSIVQCVQTKDVAFAAPGANRNGIHLELSGYASQKAADWADEYNQAMLTLAAGLCREILLPKFDIEPVFLDVPALRLSRERTKMTGFTTHRAVSLAFHESDHMDPGTSFPMAGFLKMVKGG